MDQDIVIKFFYFYLIYCHINKTSINYSLINNNLNKLLMDNYRIPSLSSEFKNEVIRELNSIFYYANNNEDNECGENLDKVKEIEDKYFKGKDDLRNIFQILKRRSNNFSEK